MNIFNTVIGLPFSIYGTFVLEERHGFNQQTGRFYIVDQIKKFFIAQFITLPVVAVVIKIVHWGGPLFFIYLWSFVVGFTLFMMIIYPEFIAPLFDKYTPLPDGELRSEIEKLADSIGFPLYKLFVVEGSKRSSHSNAYFYGFLKFKRIVLFDTLLEESEREKLKTDEDKAKEAAEKEASTVEDEKKKKVVKGCSTPEILAVLGHELGHWKLNHVMKNIVIAEVHIFAMFALFGYLYQHQLLYTAFGFDDGERPVLIGLMIILQFVTAPYNAVLDFAMTALSRRFEFQADEFAANVLGKADKLSSALINLNNDNLGFPIYDWLYSNWHHSHPPLLERLAVLKALKIQKKQN
jgi:STE24 endopeptidase